MQPFTQKYAIIQFFEDMQVGTEFFWKDWPLHSTVADVFAINWDAVTMQERLAEILHEHSWAESVAEDDLLFGKDGQARVTRLRKTDSLMRLHYDVIKMLEQGGWQPNNPEYAKEGFLPHVTVQKHARLNEGDKVVFNALSIIDFFPNQDPYERKLLATIKIGK